MLNVAMSGCKLTAVCSRANAAIQITSQTTATLNYQKCHTDRFDGYWKPIRVPLTAIGNLMVTCTLCKFMKDHKHHDIVNSRCICRICGFST